MADSHSSSPLKSQALRNRGSQARLLCGVQDGIMMCGSGASRLGPFRRKVGGVPDENCNNQIRIQSGPTRLAISFGTEQHGSRECLNLRESASGSAEMDVYIPLRLTSGPEPSIGCVFRVGTGKCRATVEMEVQPVSLRSTPNRRWLPVT